MGYRIIITDEANGQVDDIIDYVVNVLKNLTAARAIIDDIELAYKRIESSAEAFAYCEDSYIAAKEYRKLALDNHDYVIIYRVEEDLAYVVGVFHMMQDYVSKL